MERNMPMKKWTNIVAKMEHCENEIDMVMKLKNNLEKNMA